MRVYRNTPGRTSACPPGASAPSAQDLVIVINFSPTPRHSHRSGNPEPFLPSNLMRVYRNTPGRTPACPPGSSAPSAQGLVIVINSSDADCPLRPSLLTLAPSQSGKHLPTITPVRHNLSPTIPKLVARSLSPEACGRTQTKFNHATEATWRIMTKGRANPQLPHPPATRHPASPAPGQNVRICPEMSGGLKIPASPTANRPSCPSSK